MKGKVLGLLKNHARRGVINITTNDKKLAAAMNRQVTDEEGKPVEDETSTEESATQEQTTVEEDATAEKSAESEETSPEETKESENEPEMVETASDEAGKRYVPESRFKEVYARMKKAERASKAPVKEEPPVSKPIPTGMPLNKADALETELLRTALPQFNPESENYSRELDELGFSLYEGSKDNLGNYSMTRVGAGRKALAMAKKITSKVAKIKDEAKSVKAQQSDQGITNRVLKRESTKLDPDKMTLEEKEAWLRETGNW